MPAPIQLNGTVWDWSRPYVLGIVNVTPDSFHPASRFPDVAAAIAHGERLLGEGADALDIGGESTRPGAAPVSEADEIARVVPVIRALAARGALISIDTTKATVARAGFQAGARILNDVSMGDPAEVLAPIVAAHAGAYMFMHSRGTPATMAELGRYTDVVAEVGAELTAAARSIEAAGVDRTRIILDPGIGFAKRADHSLSLLAAIASIRALGYPVCVGPSRKSFIDAVEAYAPAWSFEPGSAGDRQGGTAAAVALAVTAGAEIIRVHDVAMMRQAARVAHAVRLRHGTSTGGGPG